MKKHALAVYKQPPEVFNCAQAVLHSYQTVTGKQIAPVSDYKPFGAGRAPEGECGALYAACQTVPAHADTIRAEFSKRAGSTKCRILKRELHVPCLDSVCLAAELMQEFAPQSADYNAASGS